MNDYYVSMMMYFYRSKVFKNKENIKALLLILESNSLVYNRLTMDSLFVHFLNLLILSILSLVLHELSG